MLSSGQSSAVYRIARATEALEKIIEEVVKEHDNSVNKKRVVLNDISKKITAGFGDRQVGILPGARLEVWVNPLDICVVFVDVHYKYYFISTITIYTKSITATEISGALSDELQKDTTTIRDIMSWIDKIYTAVEAKTV